MRACVRACVRVCVCVLLHRIHGFMRANFGVAKVLGFCS